MLNSPLPPDVSVTDRLQTVIAEWKGAQDGHTLERLYRDCLDLVGQEKHLLPLRIMAVRELDSESLERAIKRSRLSLEYELDTVGRFDMALVPVWRSSEQAGGTSGFLFIYEEELSVKDQVALFAHAVGHLILNHQKILEDREPPLNPDTGEIHTDRLAELRYLDIAQNRNFLDRQVLDTFQKLTKLIELPEESLVELNQATRDLDPLLRRQGWVNQYVRRPYKYTQGRIIPGSQQHGKILSVDALLRAQTSLPTAIVHVQRQEEKRDEAIARVRSASHRLCVPFAYILTTQKEIVELHWLKGTLSAPQIRATLPDRAELQNRWFSALQLTDTREIDALSYPYDLTQTPRYYQDAAINQAVIATLQARKGLRERRILLTLATGTGKTQVAFQILWKLKKTYHIRNVLFLADRGYLLDQAQTNTFGPFGDGIVRGSGEIDTAHDFLFGSYQWLTYVQDGEERYKGYPPDYFDVIIIDECHRGSADEDSRWRRVLEHFTGAVQIGLTATPLATKDVQTNKYFGSSVYTYTLSQGINDGFLAPYSVRRVLIGKESKAETDGQSTPASGPVETLDQKIVLQTAATMRQYTQAIAEHLSRYLQQQDDPRKHKTIIFCVDNTHADEMRQALEKTCASWARSGDIVRIVDDDGPEGKRALSLFCTVRERQPVIVTTSHLLSTGVDVPTCENIVLARGVGSIVEFKQIIGRGTRLFLPEKRSFTIIDYAGTIKHFSDPNFDGDPISVQREYLIPTSKDEGEADTALEAVNAEQTGSGEIERTEVTIKPTEESEAKASSEAGEQQEADESEPSILPEATSPQEIVSAPTSPDQPETLSDINAPDPRVSFQINDGKQEYEARTQESDETEEPLPTTEDREQPATEQPVEADQTSPDRTMEQPSQNGRVSATPRQESTPFSVKKATQTPEEPEFVLVEKADGQRHVVKLEELYELDASATQLRKGTKSEFAQQALQDLVKTPDDLRTYWVNPQDRQLLIEQLKEKAVVALDALAQERNQPDVDHYDLLLQILFQIPLMTRRERVQRLREVHSEFFQRFELNPLATELLDAILDKYILGEAQDVSDITLLDVQPLNARRRMEWARAFRQDTPPTNISAVLKELLQLLYSV